MIYFVDGQFVLKEDAYISVSDITIIRGYGVFEFLVTYNQVPFCLKEHLDRLFYSAKELGLNVGYSQNEIAQIVYELIERNPYPECGIKIIITGGESVDDFTPTGKSKLIALVNEFKHLDESLYQNGISVQTTPLKRALPLIKTTDYSPAIVAMLKAKREGFFDILYVDDDRNLLECSRSNFFAVKNGVIITPKVDVLPGITKDYILRHVGVEERQIRYDEIHEFDEAFTTSSTKEVLPICQIDQIVIGSPGKISKQLRELFTQSTVSC